MVSVGESARSALGLARRVSSCVSVAVPCLWRRQSGLLCAGGRCGFGDERASGGDADDRGGKPQWGNEDTGLERQAGWFVRIPGARRRTQICPRQWKGVTVGKRQKRKATAQDSFPRAASACLSHQHRPISQPASLLEQDIARWLLGRLAQLLSSRPDTAGLQARLRYGLTPLPVPVSSKCC